MQKSTRFIALMAVSWILLDSLLTYFISVYFREYTHVERAQVNYVLPFFLSIIPLVGGWRALVPPGHVAFGLAFLTVGFLMAPLLLPEFAAQHIVSVIGALCAFLAGYSCFRWSENENAPARMLLVIGGLYVIVCLLALFRVAPALFPIIGAAVDPGEIITSRPEVMTDQNFQVFYFIPVVVVLFLPYRFWRFSIAFALSVPAAYVLMRLQTRSGILVFSALGVMSFIEPIWKGLTRTRRMITLILILLSALYVGSSHIGYVLRESRGIIYRFRQADVETAGGRIIALKYLYEHIGEVSYWLPRGNAEFRKQWGILPHSNITAMFLEGGIAGLFMWVVFFVWPAVALAWRFLRRRLDRLETMILFGSISVLVVQVSLNAPFFKNVWMWAGASLGALYRSRERLAAQRREAPVYDLPDDAQPNFLPAK